MGYASFSTVSMIYQHNHRLAAAQQATSVLCSSAHFPPLPFDSLPFARCLSLDFEI